MHSTRRGLYRRATSTDRTPFAGRTAIVTGGASGIGAALGAELERRGANVVLADVDGGPPVRRVDVRDADAVRALVDEVGEVDILFNNAGISMGGPTHEFTDAHWERIVDVNLRGVINGVLAVYPRMVERGRGHIVNTASAAGLVAPPLVVPYAMTKSAVVGLTTALRPEAARHGVRVSVICPGAVETPILDRLPPADLPARDSKPVTAREYLGAVRQKPVSADRFARLALDQVARNRGIIVVPRSAKVFWYMHRLSPALTDRVARSMAGTVTKKLVRPR